MRGIQTLAPAAIVSVAAVVALVAAPRSLRVRDESVARAELVSARDRLARANPLHELNTAMRDVAAIVEPSVVYVTTAGTARTRGFGQRFVNSGSGWIYDTDGHIVTNAHVVDGAQRIEVQTHTGQVLDAEVVGIDLKTDIAVLRAEDDDLQPSMRSNELPMQGEFVFAFGSPFDFRFSMSAGIVSGIGRSAGLPDIDYENFIQTDAAINPGNSGGPLTDVYGRVIGMNTAIATGRGGTLGQGQFAGIGLAIPMDIIENVVGQIIDKGEVEKGFVGVGVLSVDEISRVLMRDPTFRCVAEHFDGQGAVVNAVTPGSPAEIAGLQVGDVITAIDGVRITDHKRVPALIGTRRPGQVAKFDVWRPVPSEARGEMREVEVALIRRAPESEAVNFASLLRGLGLAKMVTASKEACAAANVPYVRGVLLEDVTDGSAAAGVLPDGAVIVAVEGQAVGNLEEFYVRVGRLVNPTRRTLRSALVLTVALPQGGYRDVEVPLR